MKMKKALKILDVIITVLLLFVIVCNLYIAIARRATGKLQPTTFGFSTAVVVSGSMEDAISVNDLIIDKAQKEYSVGDIISFESGSSVVTHRIVGEKDGGFVTKGDANNTEDRDIVKKENIIGKVVLTVPKIGAAIGFFRSQLGLAMMAVALFAITAATGFGNKKQS